MFNIHNADSGAVMSYVVVITVGFGSEALLPQTPLRVHGGDRTYSVYHMTEAVARTEYRDLDGALLTGVYPFRTLEDAKRHVENDHRERTALHGQSMNRGRI
jgi:hypothetical protein